MAEVEASPSKEAAEGVLSPPGLERPLTEEATAAEAAATLRSVDDALHRLGNGLTHQAVMEAIREVVLSEVDARVAVKTEQLWVKGKQIMSQIQQTHKETTSKLMDEVSRCQDRQRTLEAENESLRQLIHNLSTRFSLLGQVLSGKGAGLEREDTSTAVVSTPSQVRDTPSQTRDSPFVGGAATPRSDSAAPAVAADSVGGATKLPSVPSFPLPTTPVTPEALGAATPQQKAPRFVYSLAPSIPVSLGNPGTDPGGDTGSGSTFSFTLRKADGVELGLHVSHHEHDRVLRVEGVKPDGAVGAWNRQWTGSGASTEKVVETGDKIICVNGITQDPQKMLEECREKQLLKITVMRGDRSATTTQAEAPSAGKPTALRADASVFVPGSPTMAQPTLEQECLQEAQQRSSS